MPYDILAGIAIGLSVIFFWLAFSSKPLLDTLMKDSQLHNASLKQWEPLLEAYIADYESTRAQFELAYRHQESPGLLARRAVSA